MKKNILPGAICLLCTALIAAVPAFCQNRDVSAPQPEELKSGFQITGSSENEGAPLIEAVSPPPSDEVQPLYLALVWNHHQPRYFKDPENGEYEEGWVRIHAVNAYLPMIKLVEDYPAVRCNFNITPSLMLQMLDIAEKYRDGAATDRRMRVSLKEAGALNDDDIFYMLVRYFDMPRSTMLFTSPPYRALLEKRDRHGPQTAVQHFPPPELAQLQLWFDLTWAHPMFRRPDLPLGQLWSKGVAGDRFTDDDKKLLFDTQISLLESVLPTYRRVQESGQVEVITTPYAHPILPLVYDTDLGRVALKHEPMPDPPFKRPEDARLHVKKARQLYTRVFKREPRGMWPGEGSVAQDIIPLVAGEGFSWFLSDVRVLRRSFGRRELSLADICLPYVVRQGNHRCFMLFRDTQLSDKIGFLYPKMPADEAVSDLVGQLRTTYESLPHDRPYIVTIVLDGENAWEHYPDRGEQFLRELYQRFTMEQSWLKTVRISDYLASLPPAFAVPEIPRLWPGSWIDADFHIWIGEEEENAGWEMLRRVRRDWQHMLDRQALSPETEAAVWEEILAAEGSDWFWWFGNDQESTNDSAFDVQFRNTLKNVYRLTDQPVPAFLDEPIIPPSMVIPSEFPTEYASPAVDGLVEPADEWAGGVVLKPEGAVQTMAAAGELREAGIAYDHDTLYLMARLASESGKNTPPRGTLRIWVRPEEANSFSTGNQVCLDQSFPESKAPEEHRPFTRGLGDVAEFAIPWPATEAQSYRRVGVLVSWTPENGAPEYLPGPDESTHYVLPLSEISDLSPVITLDDQAGDDRGPGTYTYPRNAVFEPGAFDLAGFDLLTSGDTAHFRFRLHENLSNPWSGPAGFSLQAFDVYLFQPHVASQPRHEALEGRNFEVEGGWHLAIISDGWKSTMVQAAAGGGTEIKAGVKVTVDPFERAIILSVPLSLIGGVGSGMRVLPVLSSHDGNGPGRIRPVTVSESEWQFGGLLKPGGPAAIDLVLPEGASQYSTLTSGEAVPPLVVE